MKPLPVASECPLCAKGFPFKPGDRRYHIGCQSLGMIPNARCQKERPRKKRKVDTATA